MDFDANEFLSSLVTEPRTGESGTDHEVWNTARAIALMNDADALVERLGCHGSDQIIQAAASRCVAAHGKQDMVGVRTACRAIEKRAHELAGTRSGV